MGRELSSKGTILLGDRSRMVDPLAVKVDENLERAIKSLKKKMDKEGIFKELRKRRSYEKPSVRRRAKRARAIRAQRRAVTQP